MEVKMKFVKQTSLAIGFTLLCTASANAFTACQVTDVGGIDDASFNQTAWHGVENAIANRGIEGRF